MEFGRKLGKTAWRAVSCLLLLLIAFHASVPGSTPLERGRGSAFSAATADVSVLRGRVAATVRRVTGLAPASGATPLGAVATFFPLLTLFCVAMRRWGPLPHAPPLPWAGFASPGARAPPFA